MLEDLADSQRDPGQETNVNPMLSGLPNADSLYNKELLAAIREIATTTFGAHRLRQDSFFISREENVIACSFSYPEIDCYHRSVNAFKIALAGDLQISSAAETLLTNKHGQCFPSKPIDRSAWGYPIDPRYNAERSYWNDFQVDCAFDPEIPDEIRQGIVKLFEKYNLFGIGRISGKELDYRNHPRKATC
ncbi:MAG: hypothetical protein H6619_03020 [Deltaproteobacteria bacterium]|nr:hypothetical protein [Deltaproteobacteria bacterium]